MKLSTIATSAFLVAATTFSTTVQASSHNLNLRGGELTCDQAESEAECLQAKDDEQHEPCVWCDSQAVSSGCFSQDQSRQLPASVFHCKTPGASSSSSSTASSSSSSSSSHETLGLTKTSFDFMQGNGTYHLLHKVHQPGEDALCDGSSKSISGYMDIKGSKYDEDYSKHLFFWMFEKRNSHLDSNKKDKKIPLIVWLTGGPGCSSTLALLTENGPCSVNDDGETTSMNPYSWTEAAHVLWLDQPAGVGYSYGTENDSNEAMISEDAYYFLQAFFQTYPEYASDDPFLYIVGESYGMFVSTRYLLCYLHLCFHIL